MNNAQGVKNRDYLMKTSTGVLGLGIIGAIWARHLHADGMLGGAWNRTAQPSFPSWKRSPEEVADAAESLMVVVADPPAVESVLRSILPRLRPAHLVIQSSTIDPASSRRFHDLVAGRGAAYVEAPFTGSKPAAEQRQTVFYMGGEPAAVARAESVLAHLSQKRFLIGLPEQAATLKLACNLQIACLMEAMCEALAWARSAGISDEVFFSALRSNAAWSGLTQLKEPKLRNRDYSPQFSVKHMLKDMRLAVLTARERLPLGAAVSDRLRLAAENGWGDQDMSALYRNLDP
jgi:3-hydroxyisobutyrate dehydrogenase-like beta-hydroxyacid dehydrogenase